MKDNSKVENSKVAKDFLGHEWHYDCMGCAIARRDIKVPGGIIYEGKYSILAADPEVPIPGFLVISFKRHVNSFSQMVNEERTEIGNILFYAEKALKELKITSEITLVQEEHSKHFHVWVFPHYQWMNEQFGSGISYLRDISSYAQEKVTNEKISEVLETVEKVRIYFQKIDVNDCDQ